MIMPSHAKNVKYYAEQMPLYARYQVEGYLNGMFNPTVQLPSGGYIVIGITEALVAIDVNSGRATKEGSIEQTALKTNLEAADEVARQLRLRDLAGLIVIDFIDMDERRNNAAVEKRFKDKLKTDRARIQVGRISGFGLMEMSRQRLRPGMLEATTQMCPHCHGTGLLRSDDNVALSILRALEEEGVRGRSKEVLIKAPISIANFLMNGKREHIADIEARYGMSVRIECDPTLVSPDFAIEKFKTATRVVPDAAPIVASAVMMDDDDVVADANIIIDSDEEGDTGTHTGDGEDKPKRKRRRRRRRRSGSGNNGENQNGDHQNGDEENEDNTADASQQEADAAPTENAPAPEAKPKRTRSRSKKPLETEAEGEAAPVEDKSAEDAAKEKPAPKKRTTSRKKADVDSEASSTDAAPEGEAVAVAEKPKSRSRAKPKPKPKETAQPAAQEPAVEPAPAPAPEPASAQEAEQPAPEAKPEPVPATAEEGTPEKAKPKRKGWWSLGG